MPPGDATAHRGGGSLWWWGCRTLRCGSLPGQDSNLRPLAYEASELTELLYPTMCSPPVVQAARATHHVVRFDGEVSRVRQEKADMP